MELVQRSCQEKTCSKILSRGLLQGSCQESFFRDLVRRPGGREQRSCSEIYYRELEQRSSVEISCRDLVQVALQRDPAQQLLQRTCQGDIAHDLLQRSSHWELAESNRNLASLLPEATFEWTPCFGYYRVTLVLLAWSHWWFWVLSTFPFGILTAHCLGSLAKVFFSENWVCTIIFWLSLLSTFICICGQYLGVPNSSGICFSGFESPGITGITWGPATSPENWHLPIMAQHPVGTTPTISIWAIWATKLCCWEWLCPKMSQYGNIYSTNHYHAMKRRGTFQTSWICLFASCFLP